MCDYDLLKISQKRKNPESVQSSAEAFKETKAVKCSGESNSDFRSTQEEGHSGYLLAKIRMFLQDTKEVRLVKAEDYFQT